MAEDFTSIVVDNGSSTIKAGFGGEDEPRVIVPNVIGRPRRAFDLEEEKVYFGENALSKRDTLNLKYPIRHGRVVDWDDMTEMWSHIFNDELHVDTTDHPILLTETALNPRLNKEKMTEIIFELFDFPAMYLAVQSVLSYYSSSCMSGIVVDSGDGATCTVPIYEGHSLPHAISHCDLAGNYLTDHMMTILNERGYSFATTAARDIARDIKEKLAYVSLNFEQDIISSPKKTYELPDGEKITIADDLFRCPEVLFRPSLIGKNTGGIHEMIYSTIMKCDMNIRKDLYANIILSGGTTMLPGFTDRLHDEIKTLAPNFTKIKVIPPKRNGAWIGGSTFSSLAVFPQMCISMNEYLEQGPSIVNTKCI